MHGLCFQSCGKSLKELKLNLWPEGPSTELELSTDVGPSMELEFSTEVGPNMELELSTAVGPNMELELSTAVGPNMEVVPKAVAEPSVVLEWIRGIFSISLETARLLKEVGEELSRWTMSLQSAWNTAAVSSQPSRAETSWNRSFRPLDRFSPSSVVTMRSNSRSFLLATMTMGGGSALPFLAVE
ncbi:hypothetical protein ANANG_G00210580 [Anguilla anguilla]|uniref:Uncharacterized protein n=1 Tax=Anguilla anguilla TaxID=7936 RepID=A0A9D3M361_ANGAN|nr:hypothetical protein ANANG_G00210580 [Anguilla anguilla]